MNKIFAQQKFSCILTRKGQNALKFRLRNLEKSEIFQKNSELLKGPHPQIMSSII